ncbi:hypothetical protein BKA70DRAFT_1416245 [Coprinopsis sp. MPI-PUGE-AT-0042]|nr:hypothetical protein BKA70DRAFT_1416245 [Coprinopsis sp. MPI-PUGE-AT-0042]
MKDVTLKVQHTLVNHIQLKLGQRNTTESMEATTRTMKTKNRDEQLSTLMKGHPNRGQAARLSRGYPDGNVLSTQESKKTAVISVDKPESVGDVTLYRE